MHVWLLSHLNAGYLASLPPLAFPVSLFKASACSFSLFDRESSAWWVRSRSIWSVGQATVACWRRTIRGSTHRSPASAPLMILNGIHVHFHIPTSEWLECNSDLILEPFFFFFFMCLPSNQFPFEQLINLHLIPDSCIKLSHKTPVSLCSISITYCIFTGLTNSPAFTKSNYTLEILDERRELFSASAICIMSSDLLEFN